MKLPQKILAKIFPPKKLPKSKISVVRTPPPAPKRTMQPPKNPMPNFRAIKICRGTTRPGNVATITNLQIGLNTRKSPYLNQGSQKNTCQTFPTPKNPEIKNFK